MQTITFSEFKKQYDVNFKAQKGDKDFIGAGGYGAVYKGHSHQMHFDVAIKRSATDKGLLDEVEKASKVPTHKNIARYLDGFRVDAESGDFDVAILQYYRKGNLTQLIENETLSEKQLDEILVGILEGLQFLHQGFRDANGKHIRIIHRDLKPQNILIAEYNGVYTPLLTDFGISKLINEEDVLSTGKVENTTDAGTLVYKAPEQIQGSKVKNNLDLWAFGVMLFRILKGYLPFYSDMSPSTDSFRREVMNQITGANLEDIFAQIADQPKKYQEVIKRCLVRNINERVQYEQELIEIIYDLVLKRNEAKELYRKKLYKEAKEVCQSILELLPDDKQAKDGLENCEIVLKKIETTQQKAQKLEQSAKYQEAIQAYKELLDIQPNHLLAKEAILRCENAQKKIEDTDIKTDEIGVKKSTPVPIIIPEPIIIDGEEKRVPTPSPIKKWGKIILFGLIGIFAVFFIIGLFSGKDTTPIVNPNTEKIDTKALQAAKADSLFTLGKGQLDSLDKNLAHQTLKRAVGLNPTLKPKVAELFTKKINKLKNVPEVAKKYEILAKDFK
ncbi:MAG: serine/threonine protein kinase [Cytophagaceae bacterium]|nr:serine/threonine protein kinase [Cytophagaceae bacterium]